MRTTFKDVNKIIGMKQNGSSFLFQRLEEALLNNDLEFIKLIVSALQNKNPQFTAKVYPFEYVMLPAEIQIQRLRNWVKEGNLAHFLFIQAEVCLMKSKKKKNCHT